MKRKFKALALTPLAIIAAVACIGATSFYYTGQFNGTFGGTSSGLILNNSIGGGVLTSGGAFTINQACSVHVLCITTNLEVGWLTNLTTGECAIGGSVTSLSTNYDNLYISAGANNIIEFTNITSLPTLVNSWTNIVN